MINDIYVELIVNNVIHYLTEFHHGPKGKFLFVHLTTAITASECSGLYEQKRILIKYLFYYNYYTIIQYNASKNDKNSK